MKSSADDFELELSFISSVMQEEVDTWNRLFELDERYRTDFFYADNFGATILNHWYSCSKRDAEYVKNEMYLFEQNQCKDKNLDPWPRIHPPRSPRGLRPLLPDHSR